MVTGHHCRAMSVLGSAVVSILAGCDRAPNERAPASNMTASVSAERHRALNGRRAAVRRLLRLVQQTWGEVFVCS